MTDDNSKDMSVVYDDRNMPLSFVRTGVNTDYLVENRYDASGNRVSKFVFTRSVTNGSAGAWMFASATHYTGVGNEIRENAGSTEAKVVVNMPQGLGRYGVSDSKSFEWYLKNHLGSTMLVYNTGTTSSVKAAYDYKAFGKRELLAQMNDRVTEELTGKELDEEVDLNYFGARYYDSDLGMWTSVDPKRQHFSPYLYGSNNPVNRVDPDGRADFFAFLEADLYLFGGGSASAGIVADVSKPHESGMYVTATNSGAGYGAGVGAGFGFTLRDVEGAGGEIDFNLAAISVSVYFDDKGFNGLGGSLGPGGGYSISSGETKTVDVSGTSASLYEKVIVPINNAVSRMLEPVSEGYKNASERRNDDN